MKSQKTKKSLVRYCIIICVVPILIFAILLAWLATYRHLSYASTWCKNIKIYAEIEVEYVPEQIFFSEEGRYLYILALEKAWQYDMLLGKNEEIVREFVLNQASRLIISAPEDSDGDDNKIVLVDDEYKRTKPHSFWPPLPEGVILSASGNASMSYTCRYVNMIFATTRPNGYYTFMEFYPVSNLPDEEKGMLRSMKAVVETNDYAIRDGIFSTDDQFFVSIHDENIYTLQSKKTIITIWQLGNQPNLEGTYEVSAYNNGLHKYTILHKPGGRRIY